MPGLASAPPFSPVDPVTEILHGVPITDPYRWLEDQGSPRTRQWIEEQTRYARSYLDHIPGRERIRERIREFLAVETYDSLQKAGKHYFFRKRLADQEQHCIYMRESADDEDQLLIDPSTRGTGVHTAVKPVRVSPDGLLLLYEVKEGGERPAKYELLEIESRRRLPDSLPRGFLRGFCFTPDSKGFCYSHEALETERSHHRAAYQHILGTEAAKDTEIFHAGEGQRIRLCLASGCRRLALYVYRVLDRTFTDIYFKSFDTNEPPQPVLGNIDYSFAFLSVEERLLAITDRDAPNRHIVEIRFRRQGEPEWIEIVPENEMPISNCILAGERIIVSYNSHSGSQILIFDPSGRRVGAIPVKAHETARTLGASPDGKEVFLEVESFADPAALYRFSFESGKRVLWAKRAVPLHSSRFNSKRVSYSSKDGTQVPMFLVGRRDVLAEGCHSTIMTSYGGYGVCLTPQFSVLVASLLERGCLFALPGIRGGSEFGERWHEAAKRRNRQNAFDDFVCAAEWLINSGRTSANKLAIFGGSNSGLLVGVAMTQRPDLFQAVLCMAPLLDMLRYHLFDTTFTSLDELGSVDDPEDFAVLAGYSPYHRVYPGITYPATMIVSGDSDGNCNPLHARKMTARLQAVNKSEIPIVLDYNAFRGHSPVLPLSDRIDALTDRVAFICDQLRLLV